MRNIIDESILELNEYIKTLNLQKYFETILKKYIVLMNKGIYIKDYLVKDNDMNRIISNFATKYELNNVEELSNISRNINLNKIEKLKKIKDKKKNIEKRISRIKEYVSKFDKAINDYKHDHSLILDKIQPTHDSLKDIVKRFENQWKNADKMTNNIEKNIIDIRINMKEIEHIILKQLFKKYLEIVKKNLEKVLDCNLKIIQSERDLFKDLYNNETRNNFKSLIDYFFNMHKYNFKIIGFKNNSHFEINFKNIYIHIKDSTDLYDTKMKKVFKTKLDSFFNKYKDFELYIQLNKLSSEYEDQQMANYLIKLMHNHYNKDIIDEYNYLCDNYLKFSEYKTKEKSNFELFKEIFPESVVETELVEDNILKFVLNETTYHTHIKSIIVNNCIVR